MTIPDLLAQLQGDEEFRGAFLADPLGTVDRLDPELARQCASELATLAEQLNSKGPDAAARIAVSLT